jgi:hypothetical protein
MCSGGLFDAYVGETLYTKFVQHPIGNDGDFGWTLTMGALNDSIRTSTVVADKPYMGIGVDWPVPAKSWTQNNFTNMCLNSCFELYGEFKSLSRHTAVSTLDESQCSLDGRFLFWLTDDSALVCHASGDPDPEHFPSSGSDYNLLVTKPASAKWPWLPGWGEDEGSGTTCATSKITEAQNATAQHVHWEIGIPK